jgi:basic membrane protein A
MMLRKIANVLLVATLVVVLVAIGACGPAAEEEAGPVKAAVLLEGPLADTGWNSSSWAALEELGEKYGWEVSYQDNVDTDNMEDLLRGYGEQGFDLVFGPGWLWAEPMTKISPEFPDTTWVNINQNVAGPDNFSSNGWVTGEAGYFSGLLAAKMTKTKKIAHIGGTESPLIAYEYERFRDVAKEVDPEIETVISYVGSWSDPAKAKELAIANIEAGVDIILAVSGSSDLGVFEAIKEAQEAGNPVMFIGWTADQCQYAPESTIVSVVQLPGDLLKLAGEDYQAGELEPGYTYYSMKQGAVSLAWCGDNVPDEIKKDVEDAIEQYNNGELEIQTATDI